MTGEKIQFLDEISASRDKDKARAASVEAAKLKTLEIQRRISSLLRKHVPQTVVTVGHENIPSDYWLKSIRGHDRHGRTLYDTSLVAEIPFEDKPVIVEIASVWYPSDEERETRLSFKMEIQDSGIDHMIIGTNKGITIRSKRELSDIPSDPVIGSSYGSYPEWEREITLEELTQYEELLGLLESDISITFTGTTPTVYKIKPLTAAEKRAGLRKRAVNKR